MTLRIEDIATAKNYQDYTSEIPVDNGLIGALFPETKKTSLTLEYIRGGDGLPAVASVHSWDAETEIGEREGFEIMSAELAQVRQKLKLDNKDAKIIAQTKDEGVLNEVIAKIYDDGNNLVKAVRTRFIAMAFEALTSGKITFDENGYTGELDYRLPETHLIDKTTNKWGGTNAKPLEDIKEWQDLIEADTGERPMRALTTRRVANKLMADESIRSAMYGLNSERVVSFAQLNNFFAEQGLPQIQVYEGKYKKRTLNETTKKYEYSMVRFIPEGKFILLPEGNLGELVYGPTPEEMVLRETNEVADEKIGNIVIDTYTTNDPVARWTRASGMGLPSFPKADKVLIVSNVATVA